MAEDFVDYLKPNLLLCNCLGIAYIVTTKSTVVSGKIIVYLLPLPFYVYHVYNFYGAINTSNRKQSRNSSVVNVSDIIGLFTSALCLWIKGAYYFIRRDTLEKLVFKVIL